MIIEFSIESERLDNDGANIPVTARVEIFTCGFEFLSFYISDTKVQILERDMSISDLQKFHDQILERQGPAFGFTKHALELVGESSRDYAKWIAGGSL